ncbi:hypothetical protein LLG96_16375 [bacterium]|nr:hypothetical protein [bacterium]
MFNHTSPSYRKIWIRLLLVSFTFIMWGTPATVHGQQTWNAWKFRMPITLTGRDTETAGLVPVDVTFSLYAHQCTSPEKEIRLILMTKEGEKEIPFQLSGLSTWTKDTDGRRSSPTVNGMITFFDEKNGADDAEYALLYGNPDAKTPDYPTDLKITGKKPAWTVENSAMTVQFHGRNQSLPENTNKDSGQISRVTLKKHSEIPFATSEGVLHWNPGIFVPSRGWIHSFAWDPPEKCEITQGPLFVEIRRSGIFPGIPEARLSITYRIFTNRSYVESGTVVEILDDIGVVALRNDEMIFPKGFFSHVAWESNRTPVVKRLDEFTPVNQHGDILRLRDDTPFVTFFSPDKSIGAASVREEYATIGPGGAPPTLFDNATYVSNGDLQYWFRPLVYFHIDWDRKQLITVPKGSVYSERNIYFFYATDGDRPIGDVIALSHAVRSKPDIKLGPYKLPPAK